MIDINGLPNFDFMIASEDVYERFQKFLSSTKNIKVEVLEIFRQKFGMKIIKDDMLPENSALFIDHKGKPVAIYKDGKIVFTEKQ